MHMAYSKNDQSAICLTVKLADLDFADDIALFKESNVEMTKPTKARWVTKYWDHVYQTDEPVSPSPLFRLVTKALSKWLATLSILEHCALLMEPI